MRLPPLRIDQGTAVIAVGIIHSVILSLIGLALVWAAIVVLMTENDHRQLRIKVDAVREIWSAPSGAARAQRSDVCTQAIE